VRGVSAVFIVGLECKNPYPTARGPFLLISHLSMWGGWGGGQKGNTHSPTANRSIFFVSTQVGSEG
jgi:hypothetical protein